MSRDITTAVDAALAAPHIPGVIFVEMDFSGGTRRLCNAGCNVVWDGYAWQGVGNLGAIDPIQEGSDLQAYGLSLQLSGIPTVNIAIALTPSNYKGLPCKVWFAPMDSNYVVLSSPVLIFQGRMDTMQIELGGTATITCTAESRLADWQRPRVRRWNQADQQARYPNDKAFEYVEQMVERQLLWGRA